MYYRYVSHSGLNIPSQKVHETFEALLKGLSFAQSTLDHLISRVTGLAKSTLQNSEQRKKVLNAQLKAIDAKIEAVENKLFDGTIIDHTYKRWMIKYEGEKAKLREDFDLSHRLESDLHRELQLMPYLMNMPKIFQDSSLAQKHAILHQVFKQGLTYKEGSFRIPSVNVGFDCKLLIIKEKWWLFLEQPSDFFEGIPSCG